MGVEAGRARLIGVLALLLYICTAAFSWFTTRSQRVGFTGLLWLSVILVAANLFQGGEWLTTVLLVAIVAYCGARLGELIGGDWPPELRSPETMAALVSSSQGKSNSDPPSRISTERLMAQLEHLAVLRGQGVLSEEEFNQLKGQLLAEAGANLRGGA